MKQQNRIKGSKGEDIAREYLQNKGYRVIDQNFRNKFGEIDLIMSKGNTLIFIEVKLKIGEQFGTPEGMIGPRKLLQVQKTAEMFLQKYPQINKNFASYQIDAFCIVLNKNNQILRVNHYENITF